MLVLVLNCGSSSVKARLVDTTSGRWLVRGLVDRIGEPEYGTLEVERPPDQSQTQASAPDHAAGLELLLRKLPEVAQAQAVGHRVVHGGESYSGAIRLSAEVARELDGLSRLAPLHNPPNLTGIRVALEQLPHLPQVAAFDTAFHSSLPEHAYRYAVPNAWYRDHGIRRYGFHGLSHAHIAERAAALTGSPDLRLVSLHLGNGCSAAAIRGQTCLDTSMGMTPLEGLIMGTRCGDLDPSIPALMETELALRPGLVERILNRDSGLEALAGTQDMRDIEAALAGSPAADLAFEMFCYRIRKYVGAYAAALGGLDALAFTAGIGENSSRVRANVCRGLEFLGVRVDATLNEGNHEEERDITEAGAPVRILVIPADEERVIARQTEAVLTAAGEP